MNSPLLASLLIPLAATAAFNSAYSQTTAQFGGDVRVRQTHFDSIPSFSDPPGIARNGENHFFRFRTRLWGDLKPGTNLRLYSRITNEFRHYENPKLHSWDFPDETIVDNLYVDLLNCFGGSFDLRAGRQDLKYGNRRVISEGTTKDGSRTIYMDAVKLSFKRFDHTTIDLLGIYNSAENQLALNSQDRDLTGYTGGDAGMDEGGGGFYAKNQSIDNLPLEAYYLFKHETSWKNPAGDLQPDADVHTIGTRLIPRLNDQWDGNFEIALQSGQRGDHDQTGVMVDASLYYHPSCLERLEPTLGAGIYYLSGDDPSTDKDEGWNPLWARWVQYSELYYYAWGERARWSNLTMPHLDFSLQPSEKTRIWGLLGALIANEDDGPGPGDYRGTLGRVRADFGDTAHWARWELSYQF
jgi:hypothetical protein